MVYYQCIAHGVTSFDGVARTLASRVIHPTREQAVAYMPEFIRRCVGNGPLDLDAKGLETSVVELEVSVQIEVGLPPKGHRR